MKQHVKEVSELLEKLTGVYSAIRQYEYIDVEPSKSAVELDALQLKVADLEREVKLKDKHIYELEVTVKNCIAKEIEIETLKHNHNHELLRLNDRHREEVRRLRQEAKMEMEYLKSVVDKFTRLAFERDSVHVPKSVPVSGKL